MLAGTAAADTGPMHPSFRPPRQAERGHRNRAARQHHAPGDGPNYTNWSRPISRLVWTMSPQVSARIQHEARKRREITGTIRVNRTRERAAPLPRTTARLPPDDSVKPQVRLPDVQAGEGAADDQALDLGGALEDREDLRVPVPALDREIAGVAVTAEHLDGLLGHPYRGLPRDQLGHGSLGVVEGDALARHPRRPPHEQPGRVHRRPHVGEHERDGLVLPDGAAELDPLPGIVAGVLEGRAGDTDRHSRNARPGRLERLHRRLLAAPAARAYPAQPIVQPVLAADQAASRYPHVIEHDLRGVRGADPVLAELLALAQSRRPWRHDKTRLAAGAERWVNRGHDDVHVRDAAVRGPRLCSVEQPFVG